MAPLLAALLASWAAGAALEVQAAAPAVRLTGVRSLPASNYTRVILDLTGRVKLTSHVLDAVPAKGLPPRIYLDFKGVRLGTRRRSVNVGGPLVRRVRLGQFKADVARATLDLKRPGSHEAVRLSNPHRVMVDVVPRSGVKINGELAVRRVVLDPGHGGKDPGAVGAGGLKEKDVVLEVARKLAPKLRRRMGVDVLLTRNADVFIPLRARTAMANAEKADLFLSIHANASHNRRTGGLETYYLGKPTNETAEKLAARENGTARRHLTDQDMDLQITLSDLKLKAYLDHSRKLACDLQSSLVRKTRTQYPRARSLGAKQGLFHVLMGARMPAALAELFFVSNRREARALQRADFQGAIAEGLLRGITHYADAAWTMGDRPLRPLEGKCKEPR